MELERAAKDATDDVVCVTARLQKEATMKSARRDLDGSSPTEVPQRPFGDVLVFPVLKLHDRGLCTAKAVRQRPLGQRQEIGDVSNASKEKNQSCPGRREKNDAHVRLGVRISGLSTDRLTARDGRPNRLAARRVADRSRRTTNRLAARRAGAR